MRSYLVRSLVPPLARLVAVLDTQELAAALDRMEKGFGVKAVK